MYERKNTHRDDIIRRFDPTKEIKVDLGALEFQILLDVLEFGAPLYEGIAAAKAERTAVNPNLNGRKLGRKRPLEEKLRFTDPW